MHALDVVSRDGACDACGESLEQGANVCMVIHNIIITCKYNIYNI